jgi:hypothetical protein
MTILKSSYPKCQLTICIRPTAARKGTAVILNRDPTAIKRIPIKIPLDQGKKPGGEQDRDSSKPLHDGEVHSRHDRSTSYYSARRTST